MIPTFQRQVVLLVAVTAGLALHGAAVGQATDAVRADLRRLVGAADVKATLPQLVKSLDATDAPTRITASLAIAALVDRVPPDAVDDDKEPDYAAAARGLLPLLGADDGGVVRAAATALGTIGPVADDATTDDVLDALVAAAARTKDHDTRACCLVAVGDFGPAARATVPAVTKQLRSPSAIVREAAAATLGAIGPESRSATGDLARLLGAEEPLVRAAAAAALGAIGPDARTATGPLARAVGDADPMVRGGAARALAAIGPDAAAAVGPLVAALTAEKDRDVIVGIIDACGEIGPRAIQAAPALVATLASPDAETREAAVAALGEIGPEAASTAAAAVERLLDDKDAFVRVAAVGGLAGLGRPAARGRRVLLEALAATDEDLQTAAAEVVADLGRVASGFSTALAKVARTAKDPRARRAAVTALGDIGGTDQAAALGAALDDADADVRHAAAWAIADLPEVVAGLGREIVAAADDDDVRVRMEIAPLLVAVGTPEALRALAELRADDDPNVADVAKQVAARAGGKSGT